MSKPQEIDVEALLVLIGSLAPRQFKDFLRRLAMDAGHLVHKIFPDEWMRLVDEACHVVSGQGASRRDTADTILGANLARWIVAHPGSDHIRMQRTWESVVLQAHHNERSTEDLEKACGLSRDELGNLREAACLRAWILGAYPTVKSVNQFVESMQAWATPYDAEAGAPHDSLGMPETEYAVRYALLHAHEKCSRTTGKPIELAHAPSVIACALVLRNPFLAEKDAQTRHAVYEALGGLLCKNPRPKMCFDDERTPAHYAALRTFVRMLGNEGVWRMFYGVIQGDGATTAHDGSTIDYTALWRVPSPERAAGIRTRALSDAHLDLDAAWQAALAAVAYEPDFEHHRHPEDHGDYSAMCKSYSDAIRRVAVRSLGEIAREQIFTRRPDPDPKMSTGTAGMNGIALAHAYNKLYEQPIEEDRLEWKVRMQRQAMLFRVAAHGLPIPSRLCEMFFPRIDTRWTPGFHPTLDSCVSGWITRQHQSSLDASQPSVHGSGNAQVVARMLDSEEYGNGLGTCDKPTMRALFWVAFRDFNRGDRAISTYPLPVLKHKLVGLPKNLLVEPLTCSERLDAIETVDPLLWTRSGDGLWAGDLLVRELERALSPETILRTAMLAGLHVAGLLEYFASPEEERGEEEKLDAKHADEIVEAVLLARDERGAYDSVLSYPAKDERIRQVAPGDWGNALAIRLRVTLRALGPAMPLSLDDISDEAMAWLAAAMLLREWGQKESIDSDGKDMLFGLAMGAIPRLFLDAIKTIRAKHATEAAPNVACTETTTESKNQEEPMSKPESAPTNTQAFSARVRAAVAAVEPDAVESGWRIAAAQFVKLAREPLVAKLSQNIAPGDEGARARIAAFLETEFGTTMLTAFLSLALGALPMSAGKVPARLARELRVRSMASAGDMAADLVMGPLREVLTTYLAGAGNETPAELGSPTEAVTMAAAPVTETVEG